VPSTLLARVAVTLAPLALVTGCGGAAPAPASAPATGPSASQAAAPAVAPLVRDPRAPAECGATPADLSAATPLLLTRLWVVAPARAVALRTPNDAEDTRLRLDGGDAGPPRFLVRARETWRVRNGPSEGAAFDAEVAGFLQRSFAQEVVGDLAIERVALRDPNVRAYAARPTSHQLAPGRADVLVLALLVEHTDGTFQSIGFYASEPMARANAAACVALAERVGSSVTLGNRTIDRSPGRRTLESPSPRSPGEGIGLTVPRDWVLLHHRDGLPDVWRALPLRPLGAPSGHAYVVVSLDGAPHVSPVRDGREVPGRVFEQPMSWLSTTTSTGSSLFASVPIAPTSAAAPSSPRPRAEIMVEARDPAALDELRAVAETLTTRRR